MKNLRRTGNASVAGLSGLPGLIVTLGLMPTAAPEWVSRIGLDLWNLASVRESCRATARQHQALEAQAEQLREEIEFVEQVAARLAAGTMTMTMAADTAEPILRDRPGFQFIAALHYPAPTFRLRVARYLSARILQRSSLFDLISWSMLATRLEVEYAAMK